MKQILFRVLLILLFTGLFALFLFFPGQTDSSSMQVSLHTEASSKTASENQKTVKIKKRNTQEPPTEPPVLEENTPLKVQKEEAEPIPEPAKQEPENQEIEKIEKIEEVEEPEKTQEDSSPEVEGAQSERIYDLNTDTSGAIEPPQIDLNSVYKKIVYPVSMKRHNVEADFEVKVYVDSTGKVSIQIPEDVNPQFQNSIKSAFKNVKAKPATMAGSPVSVVFTIPIRFQLN